MLNYKNLSVSFHMELDNLQRTRQPILNQKWHPIYRMNKASGFPSENCSPVDFFNRGTVILLILRQTVQLCRDHLGIKLCRCVACIRRTPLGHFYRFLAPIRAVVRGMPFITPRDSFRKFVASVVAGYGSFRSVPRFPCLGK